MLNKNAAQRTHVNTGIQIAQACVCDIAAIVLLWREFMEWMNQLNQKNGMNNCVSVNTRSLHDYARSLQILMTSRKGVVFLAQRNGETVGFIVGYLHQNSAYHSIRKSGVIHEIYVKKDFRNMGVATHLIKEIISWFEKKKIPLISIDVYFQNRNIRKLLTRSGFGEYKLHMRKRINASDT